MINTNKQISLLAACKDEMMKKKAFNRRCKVSIESNASVNVCQVQNIQQDEHTDVWLQSIWQRNGNTI